MATRLGLDGLERSWVGRIDAVRQQLLGEERPLDPEDLDQGGSPKSVAQAARGTSHRDWGALQLQLVRELSPRVCVELGTSLGVSSSYLAAGLQLNEKGSLTTFEVSRARAVVARDTWTQLGVRQVDLVNEAFHPDVRALRELGPIDFAFVDAHHEHRRTLDFAAALIGRLSPHGVILYDDIRHSIGMQHAWYELRAAPRVAASVDLGKVGICLYGERGELEPVHVAITSPLEGAAIEAG